LLITEFNPESNVDSRDLIPLAAVENVLFEAAFNPEVNDLIPLDALENNAFDIFAGDDIFMIYIIVKEKKKCV
jgi:hypothetical protein